MQQSTFLQHATPVPSPDITRGMIPLVLKIRMIQEGYSPSSTNKNKISPLPTDIRASIGLSGSFPTRFPLHKGAPYFIYSSLMTSPYQCWFIFIRYQDETPYFPSLDPYLLFFRMIISILDELHVFFKNNSPIFFLLHFVPMKTCFQCTILLCASSSCSSSDDFPHFSSSSTNPLGFPWLLTKTTFYLRYKFQKGKLYGILSFILFI
jgi:hypothetical protein